eukprot:894147-Prorocentrum_minimum.AAC.3
MAKSYNAIDTRDMQSHVTMVVCPSWLLQHGHRGRSCEPPSLSSSPFQGMDLCRLMWGCLIDSATDDVLLLVQLAVISYPVP